MAARTSRQKSRNGEDFALVKDIVTLHDLVDLGTGKKLGDGHVVANGHEADFPKEYVAAADEEFRAEDGTLVDCAAHQSPIITVDPDSQYVAYVRARCRFARDVWGDWSDPVSIWLNDPGDGIGTAAEPAVTLTPNPAGDHVAIAAEGGVTLVEAYAENGACTYRVESPAATIDVSRWTPGTYILRIHTPQGVATRKLVVAR